MRSVPEISRQQHGAFTLAQAAVAGWHPSAIDRAVRAGRLTRVRRGVYCLPDVLDVSSPEAARQALRTRVCAVLLAKPDCVASHASAALLSDLATLNLPIRPCVTVRPRSTGDTASVHLHRATLCADDLDRRSSRQLLRRTSETRTVYDIARESGHVAAVVTADAGLRRGSITRAGLCAYRERSKGWPGIRRAANLADLVDGRSESALESVSRLRMLEHSLPPAELQAELRDLDGRFLGRVDFYWPEYGVVGEADGLDKYGGESVLTLREEKLRQERLERAGLVVVRWGWADLRQTSELRHRLERAFARGLSRPADDHRWITTLRARPPDQPTRRSCPEPALIVPVGVGW
ncbi:putative AbiEi antitoxin of type IV toxin-antitoxin system [Jatrophihabitans sp. GAS493]|uniref:type IV toxin-antitoxin system AbiEi family antitoxin domain-containing protein n=1 Tax=Jatrophihabitans sp. GAS493 TaxID=1907575 RepID=UPI000BB78D81|nr:type IV toxin-antitoxin system AbiEi family antitoxin domain-containing protein [Jatrophihabitans sp. GAS493]SOD72391.1 putative AbiEi antitoxin of type IV toxin-antitoxin system [Jatrophihabitans sp. GAS493]